ncbi:peptidoglycan DD-metalloendopeptidase family protein [Paracidovorax wautersii]|uniref:peptidoglycan DD-metalloendopeptidase family protein n=1 Tax=Paracidovorax wautersii TaxID=1177982 RepID=UPI0031DEBF00
MLVSRGLVAWGPALLAGVLLAGCGTSVNRAPVEDRGTATGMVGSSSSAAAPAVKPLPGAENAGKPGYYTVKPGDTLIRIGLEHGQTWKDIARWNGLDNANLIEVGQVLRVVPPTTAVASAESGVVTRPVASSPLAPLPAASAAKPSASSAQASAPAAAASSHVAAGGEDDMPFIWPSSGPLLAGFDEARNKGYDIGGKAGDPVLAAADGRVVYAGAGLRGYGNLIILKHNNTYLTAYAHNQTLLVKEDQNVRRGQKIAEMGSTDADRVKLHFEIRRQGKPVDPQRYLPSR